MKTCSRCGVAGRGIDFRSGELHDKDRPGDGVRSGERGGVAKPGEGVCGGEHGTGDGVRVGGDGSARLIDGVLACACSKRCAGLRRRGSFSLAAGDGSRKTCCCPPRSASSLSVSAERIHAAFPSSELRSFSFSSRPYDGSS